MIRVFFTLLFMYAGMHRVMGQDDFIWQGRIIDQQSNLPIEGAHIKSYNRQGITDRNGRFDIHVKIGDRITISHVSYQTMIYLVEGKDMPSIISLSLSEQELGEVTVTSMPSESELKSLLLATHYVPASMEVHLQQNISYMKTIHRLNNNHIQNALDYTYQKLNSGNGEATLFSTNPSMGIVGLIRSFRSTGAIPFEKTYRRTPSLKFKSDTVSRYSDYFDYKE